LFIYIFIGKAEADIIDDHRSELRLKWDWFFADCDIRTFVPFQDCIHIAAKLRARLLKRDRAIFLVLGEKVASVSDLESLRRTVTKDKHLLRECDLNPKDKMNYDAVERFCDPEVSNLLRKHVPGN